MTGRLNPILTQLDLLKHVAQEQICLVIWTGSARQPSLIWVTHKSESQFVQFRKMKENSSSYSVYSLLNPEVTDRQYLLGSEDQEAITSLELCGKTYYSKILWGLPDIFVPSQCKQSKCWSLITNIDECEYIKIVSQDEETCNTRMIRIQDLECTKFNGVQVFCNEISAKLYEQQSLSFSEICLSSQAE